MASNTRSSGTAAFRYASALIELAMQGGAIPQIEKDIADLKLMLESSEDLRTLTRSPLVSRGVQQAALAAVAEKAKLHRLTRNFLLVLAQNRRLPEIESMLNAVGENLSARRGELRARVESATALSDAQKKTLEETLSKTVGQPVAVDATINPALIGGVAVTLGSLLIDDTVKTKLERMGRAMKYQAGKAA